jgi:hypothetical protein
MKFAPGLILTNPTPTNFFVTDSIQLFDFNYNWEHMSQKQLDSFHIPMNIEQTLQNLESQDFINLESLLN